MVEDRLERVQRLANAGAWEWTAADDALSCSEPALRLLGLPPGPCTADEALARIPADDRMERLRSHASVRLELVRLLECDHGPLRAVAETPVRLFMPRPTVAISAMSS